MTDTARFGADAAEVAAQNDAFRRTAWLAITYAPGAIQFQSASSSRCRRSRPERMKPET